MGCETTKRTANRLRSFRRTDIAQLEVITMLAGRPLFCCTFVPPLLYKTAQVVRRRSLVSRKTIVLLVIVPVPKRWLAMTESTWNPRPVRRWSGGLVANTRSKHNEVDVSMRFCGNGCDIVERNGLTHLRMFMFI